MLSQVYPEIAGHLFTASLISAPALARLGLHALVGGTIATMLTGAVPGLYV